MIDAARRAAFVVTNTQLMPVPLVPEISLHLAHEAMPIWRKTEEELGEMGVPPPFWAFAWAGGQALARYILDDPGVVRGRTVVDLASGSGLVAIAAKQAGARHVLASDIDGFAIEAIRLNAASNRVDVDASRDDLLQSDPPECDVLLVGDLFYERGLAQRLMDWLVQAHVRGTHVLIGDPGRSYLPREKLVACATYEVPVTRELEDSEIKKTSVWRLA
jgi:predicted nicotinamide N-methyase